MGKNKSFVIVSSGAIALGAKISQNKEEKDQALKCLKLLLP